MGRELSEFVSTLKTQGSALCLPIGKSLKVALDFFGFKPGQDVLVSFEAERVQIRPWNTPRAIQARMKAGAKELRELRARMQELKKDLPAATEDELDTGETVEGELLGTLECLITDDLDPAIQKLESVADLKLELSSEPKARATKRRRPGRPRSRRKASR